MCGYVHQSSGGEFYCDACGTRLDVPADQCYVCGRAFTVVTEDCGVKPINADLPPLAVGQSVRIKNAEHALFDSIALICDKKFRHYRIELNGMRLWVPDHWIEAYE